MGERKVLNKYFPPDFDPDLLPKGRRPRNGQEQVRMMMPMSVQCNTCGEYIYRGKKFNSKKEEVEGENYLGIKIYRFYMRCPVCSTEFTIKTDPKNSHYLSEVNCSMNEPWRFREQRLKEEILREREAQDESDPMKALENRTRDSKIEMDIMEGLDEIRSLNARNNKMKVEKVLEVLKTRDEMKEKEMLEKEMEEAREFFEQRATKEASHGPVSSAVVSEPKSKMSLFSNPQKKSNPIKPNISANKKILPIVISKKKCDSATSSNDFAIVKKKKLVDYGSDDDL